MNNSTKYKDNPSDWELKDGEKILVPVHNWNELKKAFWQYPVSKNSCSVHGAMTAIANTFNIDFPLETREAIWKKAKDLGASDEWGWRFDKAIKLLQNYCKEEGLQKFRYYTIQKEEFEKYAKMGFMIYGGIKVKKGSTRDKLKDGYIGDDVDTYGKSKFGHAVCFGMIGDEFGFIDNYPDKTKVNEPKFRNLDKLIENGYFFNTGYILMTDDVDEIQDALRNRKEAIAKRKEIEDNK